MAPRPLVSRGLAPLVPALVTAPLVTAPLTATPLLTAPLFRAPLVTVPLLLIAPLAAADPLGTTPRITPRPPLEEPLSECVAAAEESPLARTEEPLAATEEARPLWAALAGETVLAPLPRAPEDNCLGEGDPLAGTPPPLLTGECGEKRGSVDRWGGAGLPDCNTAPPEEPRDIGDTRGGFCGSNVAPEVAGAYGAGGRGGGSGRTFTSANICLKIEWEAMMRYRRCCKYRPHISP